MKKKLTEIIVNDTLDYIKITILIMFPIVFLQNGHTPLPLIWIEQFSHIVCPHGMIATFIVLSKQIPQVGLNVEGRSCIPIEVKRAGPIGIFFKVERVERMFSMGASLKTEREERILSMEMLLEVERIDKASSIEVLLKKKERADKTFTSSLLVVINFTT